jgi:hypothetical protein
MAEHRIKSRATILPKKRAKHAHGGEASPVSFDTRIAQGGSAGYCLETAVSSGKEELNSGGKRKKKGGRANSTDMVGKRGAIGIGKKRKRGELVKVQAKKVFVQDGTGKQMFRAAGKRGKDGQRKGGHKAMGKGKGKSKNRSWV